MPPAIQKTLDGLLLIITLGATRQLSFEPYQAVALRQELFTKDKLTVMDEAATLCNYILDLQNQLCLKRAASDESDRSYILIGSEKRLEGVLRRHNPVAH